MNNYRNEMISVVIPTHNRKDLLSRAIRSAQEQTYRSFEIIVVSDGSTDGTDETVNAICKEDPRVKYISYHPSCGGNHARNIGIQASQGTYVAFLDDDDVWYPQKLQKQLEIMQNDPAIGLVGAGINAIYEGESTTTTFIPSARYDAARQILLHNCIGSTTTVMVKKSLFEQAGTFDEALPAQQDYDMWIRLCQITKVGIVMEPCVDYYNYSNSNQISQNTSKYEHSVTLIDEKYAALFHSLSPVDNRRRKANQHLAIAKKALRNGDPKKARQYSFMAMKEYPQIMDFACWFGTFFPPKIARHIRSQLRHLKYEFTR